MMVATIRTSRLILREWREEDRDPFAAMNSDPEVMQYLFTVPDRAASDALFDRLASHHATHGFGLWAVEVPGVAPFIGFTGLSTVPFEASFTPAVEIGWRLARAYWGKGYASEAARAALEIGFTALNLDEIVSFTVPANRRSRQVMDRLGLIHDLNGDFDHPRLPDGHPLKRHVLYRIGREEWRKRNTESRPFSIRRCRVEDAPQIARVFHDSVHGLTHQEYTREQRDAWSPELRDAAWYESRLTSRHVWVAERNGQLIGFAELEANGHVDMLYIAPAAALQGIATVLYRELERHAHALGIERLFVEASETALPFFRRMGFGNTRRRDFVQDGVAIHNYAMDKSLEA